MVRAGERLEIKAATWNTLLAVADAFGGGRIEGGMAEGVAGRGKAVLVVNAGEAPVPRYAAIGIGPVANDAGTADEPVFEAVFPWTPGLVVAVAGETVPPGRVGRAAVLGTTRASVLAETGERVAPDATGAFVADGTGTGTTMALAKGDPGVVLLGAPREGPPRAPFEAWLAETPEEGHVLRVRPGRVVSDEGYAEISTGAGFRGTPDGCWQVPLPADGVARELAVTVRGATAEVALEETGTPAAGTRVVLAVVVPPVDPASPDDPGVPGDVEQRVKGDIVLGGGDGTVLGRVTGGADGVFEVELLGDGAAAGPTGTAMLVATEVSEGADLPCGAVVICHPVALAATCGEDRA